MLSLVLFFLLISSGGVYAAVRHGRRYEEAVPLTIFCGVEVMFLFGLADSLKLGVWAVCAIAAALYALSAREFRRQWKDRKKIYERLFTPAFFIFLLLLVIYASRICGRAAYQGDEFSFWATSVKKMWYGGKFACAIDKYRNFVEYPPGMGLIQYALMALRGAFTDWRLNFAYTAYVFALFLPFLKGLRFRRVPVLVLIAALILCGGMIIYPDCLNNLQVDFALGATFAYGLASLYSLGEEGGVRPFAFVNIVAAANMLVLIKAAGTLLAVILLLALLISAWSLRTETAALKAPGKKRKPPAPERKVRWREIGAYAAGLCLPFVTNRLWKVKYTLYTDASAPFFDTGKYDISEFIQILLSKTDGGYRGGIKSSFFNFLTTETMKAGFLSITNAQLVLLLAAAFLLLGRIYRETGSRKVHLCTVCTMFCFELVYWLGLLCSYMYTFSQYEGTALASMQRYLNIYHTGVLLCAVFLVLKGYPLFQWDPGLFSAVLLTALSFSSMRNVNYLFSGTYVNVSVQANQAAQDLADRLPPVQGEDEPTLLLVHRGDLPHIPVNRMRYLAYEGYNVPWECTYGSQPLEGEGAYTRIYTAGEFHQHVYDLGADYIALEHVEEDFINTYGCLFDAPPADGQIYRVPEGDGLFELISPMAGS